ncbi:MAG TPA: GerW family sporulation protein [Candidatus Galloscillospira excrementipullorum]|nr:GerW family sporulation protein [Candidatus Galloscillospira excrementipullorum]
MNEHPIQGMAESILENINQMVDVNTIVGEPIITPSGVTIIPISKVSVGFGLGGGDFKPSTPEERKCIPFGGGGGGALTITPIAFLTVSGENVKLITIDRNETTVDKALAMAPEMVDKVANTVSALLKKDSDKTKG